jgi:hypothetical protein
MTDSHTSRLQIQAMKIHPLQEQTQRLEVAARR